MSKVAATASNSQPATGIAGLINLIGANSQAGNIADQFKALVADFGNNQDAAQGNLTQQQIADLLAKEQAGGTSTTAAGSDLAQLQIKIKALLESDNASSDSSTTDPSAALISEIAALMQKFPALQEIFTGNIDTQQLQGISDALAKGSTPPDFSGLQLPSDLKSQLNALAADPSSSSEFQDIAAQIAAQPDLATEIPQALQNFAALVDPNAANNSNNSNNGLLQASNTGVTAPAAQALNNNAVNNAIQAANDKSGTGKTRPQGLLKALDQGLQAAQSSNATLQAASAQDTNSDDADSGNLETSQQSGSNSTAATAAADAQAPLFTLSTATATAPQTLTAEQANAVLQSGKTNLSTTGVSDAYAAQQVANNTAASLSPSMQVAIQMQRNAQLNNNNFMMQLHPEELGRIQVEMKFDGNKIQTKITADKQETLDSLKQDSGALTKALQSAGLQTDAGSLEFSLGGSQQQFAGKSQNNHSGNNQFGTLLASNTTDETSITATGGSQWMTLGTGRVDVKL
jgi:flagellar hook-length control protein FliK